jgi:hypothetical protein
MPGGVARTGQKIRRPAEEQAAQVGGVLVESSLKIIHLAA